MKLKLLVQLRKQLTVAAKEAKFGPIGKPGTAPDNSLVTFFTENPTPSVKQVIVELKTRFGKGSTSPNAAFMLKLLNKMETAIDPKTPIKYITSTTGLEGILGKPVLDAGAWFATNESGDVSAIYILSPEFRDSALRPETLFHELIHAALYKQLVKPDPGPLTVARVKSLKELLSKAQTHVDGNKGLRDKFAKLINTTNPFQNLNEMIAWGMGDGVFQREVLGKLDFGTKITNKKSGLDKFIDTITGLLFGANPKAESKGMATLISDVTTLIELAGTSRKAAEKRAAGKNTVATAVDGEVITTFSMASQTAAMDAIDNLTTVELFDAMDNGALDRTTQARLRILLEGMVTKLHGPFGSLKGAAVRQANTHPLSVWLKALDTGKAPFASQILASGFTGSNQQDFVMEQVEATMRAALEDKAVTTTEIYKDLDRLYTETRLRLKPS